MIGRVLGGRVVKRVLRAHRLIPLFALPVLAGCEGPLSTLEPAGPAAREIALVWWVMLTGSGVVLALVCSLFLYAFKNRTGLTGVPERAWLIGGGLAFPIAVLIALLAWALPSGQSMLPRDDGALRVEAEAFQWGWRFGYPDGGETLTVLHIPAGEPVDVAITTVDVIHSFWAPQLAGKIDAIPGQINVLRLLAEEPGLYRGQCAEFCGIGHAGMDFAVQAHEAEDYEAALARVLEEAGQ
jgi:cytochrome c oxidase subunit II